MSDSDLLSEVLFTNRSSFAAQKLTTFALGAYVVVAGMSLHFLHQNKSKSIGSRFTIVYTWSMLLITIAWSICSTWVSEVQLVEDSIPRILANPPEILAYCSALSSVGTFLSTLLYFGSDALLFFRLCMLCERRWSWIAVPGALYVSYIGIGIATNLVCFSPEFGGNLPLPPVELLANSFYIATAIVPTVLTSMICFKLLLYRHRMSKQCSTLRDNTKVYLSLVAIIVESAATYVVCSWIWVALFITNNPAIVWFTGILNAASFLAEACIVLRISMGHVHPVVLFVQTSGGLEQAHRCRCQP